MSKRERRRKNRIRLGVDHEHAYAWSRTRKGGWAVAQSPILVTTITLERLRKRGYIAMLSIYEKIAPHLKEPLYTACTELFWEEPYCLSRLFYRDTVTPTKKCGINCPKLSFC